MERVGFELSVPRRSGHSPVAASCCPNHRPPPRNFGLFGIVKIPKNRRQRDRIGPVSRECRLDPRSFKSANLQTIQLTWRVTMAIPAEARASASPQSLGARERAARFCRRFGLRVPILQAPMAGACPAGLASTIRL